MLKLPHPFSAVLSISLLFVNMPPVAAENTEEAIQSAQDLLSLSLEELTELSVSGLARQEQSVKNSPAAAFVITSEDIRRSGVTSMPELLRMVPG
ncbi:MAG: TonB-dependent receptor, partial [Methylomonas sp.]|nr:TonB-dependent receptor [Methylomonas sp.]